MRKQTKLVAVLSAAALLAIGASMTSFAAQTGWTEEDGTWVYLDKDGYKVTDSWKKSGNFWYYLDEDGYMATSKLIDNGDDNNNTYYVDETGRMVANRWIQLENEDYYDNGDDDDLSETVWYYFQSSGKAYKTSGETSFKTINGKKYAFDSEGRMLYGWVNLNSGRETGDQAYQTADYYCGTPDDGARVDNDWRKLYISQPGPDSEDDEYWFYFGANGKKVVNNEKKKINGKYYAFDENGVMQSKWYIDTPTVVASEFKGYYSDADSGARQKGWFQAVPSKNVNPGQNADDEVKWYYGNTNGTLVTSEVKSINGKKYAFNDEGVMMSGLWKLAYVQNADGTYSATKLNIGACLKIDDTNKVDALRNDEADISVVYFGSGDDGAMKTGNQTVDVDGETYAFSFGKDGGSKGKGLVGPKNNYLYVQGRKVKASTDYRYQVVDGNTGAEITVSVAADKDSSTIIPQVTGDDAYKNGAQYLVNTSGAIMKSTGATYKDTEGRVYKVWADGQIKECYWAN